MERQYYLDLAAAGLRMPIGADLVLREETDPEGVLRDGARLGPVLVKAARRFQTPLALPVMDLELEKRYLLDLLGEGGERPDTYHFDAPPGEAALAKLTSGLAGPLSPGMQALCEAISYVAGHTDLLPVGMTIGPFSLMTKLIADPIMPLALAGMGLTAAEDPGLELVEQALELATRVVLHYQRAQLRAGARAIFVAEPAANVVYLSPRQMAQGADTFERYVMTPNRRLRDQLRDYDADLLFHDCGELTEAMVTLFGQLDPALLSLGSSRRLWEDAALLPKTTVLFGNLPSKKFFSDQEITASQVAALATDLEARMRAVQHPFILGTECDVLSVPGCEATIARKVEALLTRTPTATRAPVEDPLAAASS